MPRRPDSPLVLSSREARRVWLAAQRLDTCAPFGCGPEAVAATVRHLGYVQIDVIHVVERAHHHILFARIPDYRRTDLSTAQSEAKSVFEVWTHALSYAPVGDWRFFMRQMREDWRRRAWFGSVRPAEVRALLRRIETEGPLTIRDIEEEPEEKAHLWASRKPTKRILQQAFHQGLLTISARHGALKTYELTERHFGWEKQPKAASEAEIIAYKLDRALQAQGLVNLDSICHLDAQSKPKVLALIERRVTRRQLRQVTIEGARGDYWATDDALAARASPPPDLVHILSPFDPLVIQRKRLAALFGYDHRFEAYVPEAKRVLGYFALPVLAGDEIVAAIDCKADREARKLLIRRWTWVGRGNERDHKALVEAELQRFERFQFRT